MRPARTRELALREKRMRFTKMHGIGNDFVIVSLFDETAPEPASLAREVCQRRFGVGADGLILVGPSAQADASMRIFNPDGGEAEMCGNGIRCLAKYCRERGLCRGSEMTVETLAGVKALTLTVEHGEVRAVRVDMGVPSLARKDIPMTGPVEATCVEQTLDCGGELIRCTCVNMGNPHCVSFVDDLDSTPVSRLGPKVERASAFPERVNAHFVQTVSRGEVRMETWERGAGETPACGTGASAVCVAGCLTGRTDRRILVHLPGGDLEIDFAEDDHVFMTGPAETVFDGVWP